MSTGRLTVRLFAALKEKAGRDSVTIALPAGTTVGRLAALVRAAEPSLAPFLAATRVAVNLTFASDEQVLQPGDDVALIPPVSGG